MVRPNLKFEPGENPSPEELQDELPGVGAGAGEEDAGEDTLGEEDGGAEGFDGGDQSEEIDEPARPGHRSSGQRLKEFRDQARAEAERAAAAERELYNLRQQQEQLRNQQQQWEQQREEQNLENMPYEQQIEYRLRRAQERNDQQVKQLQFQGVMNQDKAEYMSKCSTDANRRRLKDVVEQTYFQAINSGRYIPRDEIYRWARGKEVEEQEQAQTRKRTSSPQAQAQRVRAPNSRSDSVTARSRGGGRANETLEQRMRRLENIRF